MSNRFNIYITGIGSICSAGSIVFAIMGMASNGMWSQLFDLYVVILAVSIITFPVNARNYIRYRYNAEI